MKISKKKGFVLLYTVLLSSIILAVALGSAKVALKEVVFGTSAKDTNEAFFAADTGAECALFNDKPDTVAFPISGGGVSPILCAGSSIDVVESGSASNKSWNFAVGNLSDGQAGCASVTVNKDSSAPPTITTITSKGYNNGSVVNSVCVNPAESVERELQLAY